MTNILNKIKDKKLRDLLTAYSKLPNEFGLIDILSSFGISFRIDAFEAVIPKLEISEDKIYLGGFIIDGTLYGAYIEVKDTPVLRIGVEYYMLIPYKPKAEKGE